MTASLIVPSIDDPGKLRCLARARTYNQYCSMVENAIRGICPFCQVNRERNKVVFEDEQFWVWHCNPPEKHTSLHLLIVPKRHVVVSAHLLDAELLRFAQLPLEMASRFQLTHYGILVRENAPEMAGTIEHLHKHLMVEDGTGRLETPFSKGAESEAESVARATVFEKLRQGWKPHLLTSVEWKLVFDRVPAEMVIARTQHD